LHAAAAAADVMGGLEMQRTVLLLLTILVVTGCKGSVPQPAASDSSPPLAAEQTSMPPGAHDMPRMPMSLADWAKGARLFENLGNFHRKVTTSSSEAQQYFDQGMRFLWAFNHDESTRSFARAAELDPKCASCYWGVALTVGPNYNLPLMLEPRAKVAFEAVQLAQQNSAHATPVELALIEAVARRYPNAQPVDPSNSAPILSAYAEAMKNVARQFPDDLDVQTLYAEALMNITPWKLWSADGKPSPGTAEIQKTLEFVMSRDPRHPGANHYYVHTLEASPHPEKAIASAERLRGMMPAAGHLEHMPAHILQRVGRYEEAAEANRKGAESDELYLKTTQPLDYYTMYTGHNYQFLAYSAAMEGRKQETLEAVRNSRRVIADEMLLAMPGFDWYLAEEYAATVRFGLWDEMLAKSAPDPKLRALTGGYLYGKGVALASKGQVADAKATLADLEKLVAEVPADAPSGFNTTKDVLGVAVAIVKARIAAAEHHSDEALTELRDAVAREDKLAYDEPSDWFFPVRHLLGAQLLAANRATEAEAVYREDLGRNPANGWSLYGLSTALKAQRKAEEAARVEAQLRDAWKNADTQLTASAF
jgi:tetratricopeptide (TPR) repeat protein